jgi:hypothetical protein
MKTAKLTVLCALSLVLLGAANPFVGTWRLNSEKSKFSRGAPGFFLGAIQIELAENGLKSTVSSTDNKGNVDNLTFNCQLNGTPCPVGSANLTLTSPSAIDTISLKLVGQNTILADGTRKGKPIYSDRRVVSADGKTMTVIRKGTTPEGSTYQSTIVLDRIR